MDCKKFKNFRYWLIWFFLIITFILSGCLVGPDFHGIYFPKRAEKTYNQLLNNYTVAYAPASLKKASQSTLLFNIEDIPAQWWYLFHSPAINSLVKRGIEKNKNLAAAYASLRIAQEILNANKGRLLFPATDLNVAGQRGNVYANTASSSSSSQNSFEATGVVFNLLTSAVNVSYTFDVFGGARRQLEGLQAQVDNQKFELIAVYLTLTTGIVSTAINIAAVEEEIKTTKELIHAQKKQFLITKKQFLLGGTNQQEVLRQQTLLEQARALLPPLQNNLAILQHALAILIGEVPGTALPFLHFNDLQLPRNLPISLASQLICQRPDVRAAEALVHAASAQIGVATANLLPQFTFNGIDGWELLIIPKILRQTQHIWEATMGLAQPIFHGGALFAQRRQAIAGYQQALAQYQQILLQAFKNVADSIMAIKADQKILLNQTQAEKALLNSLSLASKQYQLGAINELDLLTAKQNYQQAVLTRLRTQSALYTDTVALFQALGGGWWHSSLARVNCCIAKKCQVSLNDIVNGKPN